MTAGWAVARERVVAVVASLPSGRTQVGTGYLVTGCLVVTAEHCTRDKITGAAAPQLRVVRASDGAELTPVDIVASAEQDIALLTLPPGGFGHDYAQPVYARVDQEHTGVLSDCVTIGFPLFQYDTDTRQRSTAELHGVIYQTDAAESGRLLMREPLLSSVSSPATLSTESAWGGLSGAVVFHAGEALGVVVEHHPQQSGSAVQLASFDQLAERAQVDPIAAQMATALGLTGAEPLPVATADGSWANPAASSDLSAGVRVPASAGPEAGWEAWRDTALLPDDVAALEVLISPSGHHVAIAANDGTVTVARSDGDLRRHLVDGHHLAFAGDGAQLVVAHNQDVQLVSLGSGEIRRLATVNGTISGLVSNGHFVLVAASNLDENLARGLAHAGEKHPPRNPGSPDDLLCIVDLRSGEMSEHDSWHEISPRMAVTADGHRLALAATPLFGRSFIAVIDVPTWQRRSKLRLDKNETVTCMAFHPDSLALAAGTTAGRVDVFLTATESSRGPIHLDVGGHVHTVAFSDDGRHVVVAAEGSAQLWQLSPPERLGLLPMAACRAAAWVDGRLIAAGAYTQRARTRKESWALPGFALTGEVRVATVDL